MSAPAYVLRAAGPADLDGFKQLREIAGAGFTSLMLDDKAMAQKLELSAASFASTTTVAGAERYFIALEHVESGALAGCCGVKSTIGEMPPFFNFRLITEAQSSAVVSRRFDMDVLIGVNDFTGCSEVGSLFLRPEHRAAGVGRALAQCRYMLMAAAPQRFRELVVSELRGVVSAEGVSPFWEAVGRHFFGMDFPDADYLSMRDKRFIAELMPRHPLYVPLLPAAAQAPAVDNVAYQIKLIGIIMPQEIEQEFRLTVFGAQMNIGQPDRAVTIGGRIVVLLWRWNHDVRVVLLGFSAR